MAWITPVTDRQQGARTRPADMNRIAGNLDYLTETLGSHSLYYGRTIAKTAYTQNDFATRADWTNVLAVLTDLQSALDLPGAGQATDATTYENFNMVESITLALYERTEQLLAQEALNHFSGQGYYSRSDAAQFYAGGLL